MNIYSFLSVIIFCFHLTLGIHVFCIDRKSSINRLFFIISIFLALVSFCSIFAYSALTEADYYFWFKLAFISVFFYYASSLHFFLVFTKLFKVNIIIYILIYLPAVFFSLHIISYADGIPCLEEYYKNQEWVFVILNNIWSYLYLGYMYLTILLRFILIYRWGKKAVSKKAKMQFIIIISAFIVEVFFNTTEVIFLPFFTDYMTRGLNSIFYIIEMIAILYVILKFRFLSITPEIVSKDVLMNIDEFIILLDGKAEIMLLNRKAEDFIKNKEFKGLPLSKIILEHKKLNSELKNLIINNQNTLSCRFNLLDNSGNKLLIEAKFSVIRDRYNDLIGFLMIGKEVKEFIQLKEHFKITEREAEVIEYIINGHSYKQAGSELGITERTIKEHVTNIYHKLGVENKAQFFAFIKDFNLYPENSADKTILTHI